MSTIIIDVHKSVEENAGFYFDKAKHMKKKVKGALVALEKSKKDLEKLQKEVIEEAKPKLSKLPVKREWYEKFRWFSTSEDFLVIMGRDATTNEIIIKKHTSDNDLIFHTDMAGSPFAVIKAEGKEIGIASIEEAAQATASYSRAWKLGLSTLDVFYVKPDQVTKKARPGEFLQKGSFMVYGKSTYLRPTLRLAIGTTEIGSVIGGPEPAIKKHAKSYVNIIQGNEQPSDIAKKLHHKFNAPIDDILRFLPSGGCKIES